jgi:histone-lysine N-methyltransferase SETD3
MSARSAAADPDLVAAFESHGAALTPADRLCVHLLREAARGDASPWRAYVAQLPRRYDALAGWTSAQRDELQAPHAIRAARDAARDARDAHARAVRTLEALALPAAFRTPRAWLWARGATASRTVHVPFDPAGAMCPVGDLFNYAPPPAEDEGAPDVLGSPLDPSSDERGGFERGSSFDDYSNAASNGPRFAGDGAWDEASDAYVFRARAPYRAGEQISLCYGRHANLALLEHYGFLLPMYAPNPNDEAPIGAFFEEDPGAAGGDDRGAASLVTRRAAEALRDLSKAETTNTREEEEEGRDVPRTLAFLPNGRLPWTALRDARLAALGPNPPRDARASVAVGGAAGADFERRAFRLARDAAAAALLAMPTTAREDLAAIQRSLMRRSSFRRGRGGEEEPDDKREENDEAREGGGGCGGRTWGGGGVGRGGGRRGGGGDEPGSEPESEGARRVGGADGVDAGGGRGRRRRGRRRARTSR